MRRRLLLSAATSFLAAPAVLAQPGRVPRIGALFASDEQFFPDLLRQVLEQRGWRPGSYVLEIRSGGGRGDRLDALAKELVAAKVDLILAIQTPAGLAAQRATREIPIVVTAADPIGTGLVTSIARPEGNVTGIDNAGRALQTKRVELLKEILPQMRRLGAMVNPADPFHKPYLAQTQEAAVAFGLAVEPVLVTDAESGLRDMLGRNVDAVLIQPSLPLPILAPRLREARMPAMSGSPAFVKA